MGDAYPIFPDTFAHYMLKTLLHRRGAVSELIANVYQLIVDATCSGRLEDWATGHQHRNAIKWSHHTFAAVVQQQMPSLQSLYPVEGP